MEQRQNKKTQTFLLLAVVLIWGAIAWRFMRLRHPENNNPVSSHRRQARKDTSARPLDLDTLTLNLSYPDPFFTVLQPYPVGNKRKRSGGKYISSVSAQASPVISSSALQYIGFSKDASGRVRARVLFNGKGVTLSAGEAREGMVLLTADKNMATIEMNQQKLLVRRQ